MSNLLRSPGKPSQRKRSASAPVCFSSTSEPPSRSPDNPPPFPKTVQLWELPGLKSSPESLSQTLDIPPHLKDLEEVLYSGLKKALKIQKKMLPSRTAEAAESRAAQILRDRYAPQHKPECELDAATESAENEKSSSIEIAEEALPESQQDVALDAGRISLKDSIFQRPEIDHVNLYTVENPIPSRPKGYKSLADISIDLKRNLGNNFVDNLEQLFNGNKSEREMFSTLWGCKQTHQTILASAVFFDKNMVRCIESKNTANEYYRNKDYGNAMSYYNLALMEAPHPVIPTTLPKSIRTLLGAFNNENDLCAFFSNNQTSSSSEVAPNPPEVAPNPPEVAPNPPVVAPSVSVQFSTIAKIYANRSAVLFTLQKYERCLMDINFASLYGLPSHLLTNLGKRRRLCIQALNLTKTAYAEEPSPNFSKFVEKFDKYKETGNMTDILDMLLSPCTKSDIDARERRSQFYMEPPDLKFSNLSIPNLSKSAILTTNQTKGRHIIAQQPIRPGELVCVDPCFASVLHPACQSDYCNMCLKVIEFIQPCIFCSRVTFCSVECWVEGMTGNHLRECNALQVLYHMDLSADRVMTPILVYKIFLNLGHDFFIKNIPILEKERNFAPIHRGFDPSGRYKSEDFRTVYNLVTNKELRTTEELYSVTVVAVFLLKMLETSGRFFLDVNDHVTQPSKMEELELGGLLVKILLGVLCNTNVITDTWMVEKNPRINVRAIGVGLYPTLALLNHSCNGTSRLKYHGNTLVARACTFIPRGGEITFNYASNYYSETLESRRKRMESYFVTCKCEACISDWPLYQQLNPVVLVKCINCETGVSIAAVKPICPKCKIEYDPKIRSQLSWWRAAKHLKLARERYTVTAMKLQQNGRPVAEDIFAIGNYIEVMRKLSYLPHQEYCYAQELLYKVFLFNVSF